MNPKVDAYISKAQKWQAEIQQLRSLVLANELTEELKWGVPCYMWNGSNVLLIHAFKAYCALLFCKGALLQDTHSLLIQQTDTVQAARQIRFTQLSQITKQQAILTSYIRQAIEIEKAGLKVHFKKVEAFPIAEEFQQALQQMPALKQAFYALTPGRQKGYLLHFSQAKQSTTRASRVEQCIQRILNGKGIDDCTCGLSKRMPSCDGSHKHIL